jgi:hypothetical protein
LWLGLLHLAALVPDVHAAQDVIGEEKLPVGGHHHDLQLVGKPLGYDLVDEQWILL